MGTTFGIDFNILKPKTLRTVCSCCRVSSCILDFVEKAKVTAASAREYSLEARELVREMYPEFEQPGRICDPFADFLFDYSPSSSAETHQRFSIVYTLNAPALGTCSEAEYVDISKTILAWSSSTDFHGFLSSSYLTR